MAKGGPCRLSAVAGTVACALALAPAAHAALTASLAAGTLTVTSDGASDKVTLSGNGGFLDVDFGSDGTVDGSFDRSQLTATLVNMGAGDDSVTMANTLASDGITVNAGDGSDTVNGGAGPETINGDGGRDALAGLGGNDTVNGGDGDDSISWTPGSGNDLVDGGPDHDSYTFLGSAGSEITTLVGLGNGHAQVTRNVGSVTVDVSGIEDVSIYLLAGDDTYTGGTGAASAAGLFQSIVVNGGTATSADTLTGGDADETLVGGGPETDTVNGGAGNDTFPTGEGDAADTIDGQTGTDTLAVTGTDYSETYQVQSLGGTTYGVGQSPDNSFQSASNVERVALETLGGNDTVSMTPTASSGIALDVSAGDGNDTVTGGQLGDVLRGGGGADVLTGLGGNDSLFGDAGTDTLTGGLGADDFHCGGYGDALDATSEDTVDADCLAPTPPSNTSGGGSTPPVTPPAQPQTIAVAAFLAVSASGDLKALRIAVKNGHSAAQRITLRATEIAPGVKRVRYRPQTKTIAAGRSVTFTLKTPAKLRKKLAALLRRRGKIARSPSITLTNADTDAKLSMKPRIVITRR